METSCGKSRNSNKENHFIFVIFVIIFVIINTKSVRKICALSAANLLSDSVSRFCLQNNSKLRIQVIIDLSTEPA